MPFEAIPPVLGVSGVSLTDEKLALLLLTLAWLSLGRHAIPTQRERRALLPTLALVLVALASATLAPTDYAGEALRYVARLLAAGLAFLVAVRLARQPARTTGLLWAIALGAGASALLGIGEAVRWPQFDPLLALFKVAPTRVGGELRVSASFQYATIAAMYFEMVAPLAIVLAASESRRRLEVAATIVAVLCTANVVLSLTRAGVITLAVIYAALIAGAVARRAWQSLLVPTAACALVLAGGIVLQLVRNPVFDLRLVTESDADWYGAVYSAPPNVSLQAGGPATVDIDVRNEGRMTWTTSGNHPFALGYRWLTDDGTGVLDIPPQEVPLGHDVEPGDTVHLHATVNVPDLPDGTYTLDWGMLQRDVLEFYERGWADAETHVSVTGASNAAMPVVTPRDDAEAPWVVGRLDLWGSALQLFAAHPVLGVGPDNFRHFYGAQLGLEAWDERIQANNVYLEVLADLGLVGLGVFVWLVGGPLAAVLRAPRNMLTVGLGAAISAFVIHGLLDSFLAFTPTALLFWMLLGLARAPRFQNPQVSGR